MPKVKVKKIQKSVIDNEHLNDIIAQLVGQDRNSENVANAHIIYDHYCKLESLCLEFINKVIRFNKFFFEGAPPYLKTVQESLTAYANDFIKRYKLVFKLNKDLYKRLPEMYMVANAVPKELLYELRNIGYDARESELCKEIIIVCSVLKEIGMKKLSGEEIAEKIEKMTPVEFTPFAPRCKIDFKYMVDNSGLKKEQKIMIGKLLFDVNRIGYEVYDVIGTPCVDLDNLIDMILAQFKMFKSELRGCDEAFKLIERSTHLFKDNFKTYYRRFMGSGNQTSIILEEYLSDVVKEAGSDVKTVHQVKKLMLFIRKKISEKTKQGGAPPEQVANLINNMDKQVDTFSKILEKLEKNEDGTEGEEVNDGKILEGEEMIKNLEGLMGNMFNFEPEEKEQ